MLGFFHIKTCSKLTKLDYQFSFVKNKVKDARTTENKKTGLTKEKAVKN